MKENMNPLQTIRMLVYEKRPVLQQVIASCETMTLGDYFLGFGAGTPGETIEKREMLAHVAANYARRLVGDAIARPLESQIMTSPLIITGNHHGADWNALTSQPPIMWAACRSDEVIPIFACAAVPLNNTVGYGRGIRITERLKINIFPDKDKEMLIGVAPKMTKAMIEKALLGLGSQNWNNAAEENAVRGILAEDYLNPEVLNANSFSDQSVLLCSRLWKRLTSGFGMPELAYLEIEKIVALLLEHDLEKSYFIRTLLFNEEVRGRLMKSLNGAPGCWDREKLEKLLDLETKSDLRRQLLGGAGTMFFWGIDAKGRRVPMILHGNILKGRGDGGELYEVEFKPESILKALQEGKLLPGLFMDHLPITFARGYKPYGGFMQTDYLTKMRLGILEALGDSSWSSSIALLPTANYLNGLIFAVNQTEDGFVAAETVRIITAGGLYIEQFRRIPEITVGQATAAGLIGMYEIIYGPQKDVGLIQRAKAELADSGLIQIN